MSGSLAEDIADHLPRYLSDDTKATFKKALEDWPRVMAYYVGKLHESEPLQGDVWSGIPVRDFASGNLKIVNAVILSNSCDIDESNRRAVPSRVVVAPLIKLSKYTSLLEKAGVPPPEIAQKIAAIKSQLITSIIYYPADQGVREDSIIVLDDIHSLPVSVLTADTSVCKKTVTLAMVGFYLFVFKLSVNFCRLHEKVQR